MNNGYQDATPCAPRLPSNGRQPQPALRPRSVRFDRAEVERRLRARSPGLIDAVLALANDFAVRGTYAIEPLRPREVNRDLQRLAEASSAFHELLGSLDPRTRAYFALSSRKSGRTDPLARTLAAVGELRAQTVAHSSPRAVPVARPTEEARLWLARSLRDLLNRFGVQPTRFPHHPYMSLLDYVFDTAGARRDAFELARRVLSEPPKP
jgi:hypothetical protein